MSRELVVILAGGWSREREVSLAGGGACAEELQQAGREVLVLDPASELDRLMELAPKVKAVLPILHGPYGEDGRIQGFLDCLSLPYPGAGVTASALAIDKALAKEVYRRTGLRVARDAVLTRGREYDPGEVAARVGLPAVVKPAKEGSTFGIGLAETPGELKEAVERAFGLDENVLVEEYLSGREITGGVLDLPGRGPTALPLIEIIPKGKTLFDYEAKYTPGGAEEICPADLDEEIAARAREMALIAHQALGIVHFSRTDMFLQEGEIYVLETNTLPGMTETSLLPQAAAAAGLDLTVLLDRLVELAVRDRGGDRPAR